MLEKLLQTLSVLKPLLGDSIVLFSIAVGIAFGLIALAGLYLMSGSVSPVRKRLSSSEKAELVSAPNTAKKIDRAVAPIKGVILPTKAKELGRTQQRLVYAGFRGSESISAFYAIKLLLILTLGPVFGLIVFLLPGTSSNTILAAIGCGALAGMIIPSIFVDKRISKRKEEVVNAFPDILDLLVACSEAGLGLNAAIQRVARETSTMYPVLSAELDLVNSEIRAGVNRIDALHNLSDRTGVEEISGFVSMVSQSVKFGTSIAETLRIYAEEFRDKRMQRAEEQAAKVGTKLLFPLILCIFPAFFVVAIGPAVISIIRAFEHMR